MKARDFSDRLQKTTLPDENIFGLFVTKEDFERTDPIFNGKAGFDEKEYRISDEDWARALETMSFKSVDRLWERLYEIIEEALSTIHQNKEKQQ